jgi:hypothetical protein
MYGTRGRHADGGSAAPSGNMAPNMPKYGAPHYKHGGKTHRRHHAEGDMTGVSPITGERSPDTIARRRGGRACHAAGDIVATPYRRGGKTHRSHHEEGSEVEAMHRGGLKKGRKHHNAGNVVNNSAATMQVPPGAMSGSGVSSYLNGPRKGLARGGAGKVRKGMLSPSGKIINSYNRTRRPN